MLVNSQILNMANPTGRINEPLFWLVRFCFPLRSLSRSFGGNGEDFGCVWRSTIWSKTNGGRDVMTFKWPRHCGNCRFKYPSGPVRAAATCDVRLVPRQAIIPIPIITERPCCLHSSPLLVFHKTKRKLDPNPDCLVTFSCQLSLYLTFPVDVLAPVIAGYLVTEVIRQSSAPSTGWMATFLPLLCMTVAACHATLALGDHM